MNTSPLTWTSAKRDILDANGKRVCLVASQACTVQEDVRNAAFIVRAVNCHAELVAALESICNQFDISEDGWDVSDNSITDAKVALSNAKQTEPTP